MRAIAALLALGVTLVQGAAGPPFELPPPTGPFRVGTTVWRLIDQSRRETFAPDGPRQVEVLAWYPSSGNPGGKTAPYLREGVPEVRTFARLFGAPEQIFDALADVRTHAAVDAVPASAPAKFPLLIFSHGYTGIPSAYTALLEDLASHGYGVLSIVHPYEATAATLTDGRVVTLLDPAGAPLPPLRAVLAEWGAEDETMAAVTRATDVTEQLRLLRGYLGGLHQTDIALRRWVDDTTLVLDRLSHVGSGSPIARIASRLDMTRVGVFGHSMGGVAAAQFCVEDRRCRAGLNLDGIPQYGPMIDLTLPRPFLMVYSARPGRLGASDAIYQRAAHPYVRIDVRDTRHLDFSDMAFWGGPLRARPVLGGIDPVRGAALTRSIVRRYFDQELLGKRAALAEGLSAFPEVTMRTAAPAAR